MTIGTVFVAAIVGGVLASKLRMPAVIGYIAAGVCLGNIAVRHLDIHFIETIGEVGVTLLLFTLGLEFSFHRLRKILPPLVAPALLQVVVTALVILPSLLLIGLPYYASVLIAIAGALSSTAVVIRVLTERGELESVPGEVLTGWLVVQDLLVIPIMVFLPTIVSLAGRPLSPAAIAGLVARDTLISAAVIGVVVILGRVVVPRILTWVASINSREVLLIAVVGLVFTLAVGFASFGLSAALGAFIAGLIIAETSEHHEIFSEIRPLRDLFAIIFFVSLGLSLPIGDVIASLPVVGIVLLLLFCVKMPLTYGICRFLGYHQKTAFLVGVGLFQMSEFGFILGKLGISLGIIDAHTYANIVAVTFASIIIGAPFLSSGHRLYYRCKHTIFRYMPKLFRNTESSTSSEELPYQDHVVVCGYGRVGKYVGRALTMANVPYLVVDYNHATVRTLVEKGIPVLFGDPADRDVLDTAQVDKAKAVVIAIPDRHTQELIIGNSLTLNRSVSIYCRSHHEEDQKDLKTLGVTAVIQPEFEAALSIVHKVLVSYGTESADIAGKISRLKIEHGLG
jgi:CPA2 family monovalent cation:H+ antiporter-2